jgi:hypothetical protein
MAQRARRPAIGLGAPRAARVAAGDQMVLTRVSEISDICAKYLTFFEPGHA